MKMRRLTLMSTLIVVLSILSYAQEQTISPNSIEKPTPEMMKQAILYQIKQSGPMVKESLIKHDLPRFDKNDDSEFSLAEFKDWIDSQAIEFSGPNWQFKSTDSDERQTVELPDLLKKSLLAAEDENKEEEFTKALKATFTDYDGDQSDNLDLDELVEYSIDQMSVIMDFTVENQEDGDEKTHGEEQ